MNLFLILGNQLFPKDKIPPSFTKNDSIIFMREDRELCTYFRFHKQKITYFLSAMRSHRDALRAAKFNVHYEELSAKKKSDPYDDALAKFIGKNKIRSVTCFEIEDHFFATRISELCRKLDVSLTVLPSPMFLTSREAFKAYISKTKRPFMKTFYQSQRRRLKVLVTKTGEPIGGQWSFDEENRLKLPINVRPPEPISIPSSRHVKEVQAMVEKQFPDHPGSLSPLLYPVDRAGALEWLKDFLENRLIKFGPFEDALATHSTFVFHSVLTPLLNCGLITPDEVVTESLKLAKQKKIELPSLEGFIRQVIGWREFIRGIYHEFDHLQSKENFFNHQRKLSSAWYSGGSGIPPLDFAIEKINRVAYAHHIERLMVIGSLMTLTEIEPREAHRWFMEMFIDSSDWVMGPNVYGMALFSDGGIFATKPYICGSNYYLKMGSFSKGDWCDEVDGLYWNFIRNHKDFFSKNPRLSMMLRSLEKIPSDRMERITRAAKAARDRLTV